MKARQYSVSMTGVTPLLLHNDNILWSEVMRKWGLDPANKRGSVAGDDRSPAFRWFGCLYIEGGNVVIPADNLMTVLREGGKRCPTGKGQSTFKAQTQSGIVIDQSSWPIEVNGHTVPASPLEQLAASQELDFAKHEECAKGLGFELFVKRAKVGAAKHVRVRPLFRNWVLQGSLTVFDEQITTEVLKNILTFSGAYAGLGDWRPSSPKSPGSFGKFTATVSEL